MYVGLMLITTFCREPFTPDFETGTNDYLVVEGFINVGIKGVTTIKLSRVAPLLTSKRVSEKSASINIENETGSKFPLYEVSNGIYLSDSLNLDQTNKYKLLIKTHNGKQYESALVQSKITPAIDSINWRWEDTGINFYVNAHDTENNTQYYKWDYQETWEINSDYVSQYTYINGKLEVRNTKEKKDMFYCWQYGISKDLHFASTSQFDIDKIRYRIASLPHYSDRTSVKYSILVNQRALSKEEFDYLQIIQKNSSVTGSLFDPLPGEIKGNIESLDDASEPVIGYIGAYTQQTKRIFLLVSQLNADPNAKCESVNVEIESLDKFFGSEGAYTPITITNPELSTGAAKYCMDCRLRGGSPIEPDYWQ